MDVEDAGEPRGIVLAKAAAGDAVRELPEPSTAGRGNLAPGDARRCERELDEIARDVLSNGVIEDYRVEILD